MDMDTLPSTSEIVESTDELGFNSKMDEKAGKCSISKSGNRYSIEDDINRLFESVNFRNSAKGVGLSNDSGRDALRKKAMKRPIRVGSPQMSGIGISEPVSLKQALRGLCISQASEVAAMKRLSRPAAPSGPSEAGAIRRLYRAVVVEASGAGLPLNEGSGNLVEISLVPESIILNSSDKFLNASHVAKEEFSNQPARSSRDKVLTELTGFGGEILTGKVGTLKTSPEKLLECSDMTQAHCSVQTAHLSQDELCPCRSGFGTQMMAGVGRLGSLGSSSTHHPSEESQQVDEIASTSGASVKTPMPEEQKDLSNAAPLPSISSPGGISSSSAWNSPRFMKPIFRGKSFIRRKMKQDSDSTLSSSKSCNRGVRSDQDPCTSNLDNGTHECASRSGKEESRNAASACKNISQSSESNPSIAGATSSKLGSTSNSGNRNGYILNKIDDRSRSREKGEFSQSSKSSIGDYSSSTSISEDSNLSSSSRSGNRPHMSRDLRWDAVRHIQKQHGNLCLKHFKLTKKLGCGDIGSVYLAELCGTGCLFALKVMDNEFLASRKKMSRAQTEKEILQMLDHPFLPTLYAHFLSDKFSCLVMEYCPGGDLHVLRQKQPSRTFSEQAARFYIAEVLLALEYLHMLGVVYRDLKPENVLVREDGHIMLTDFDLSLRCAVDPILLQSTSPVEEPTRKVSSPCSESSCIDPFCLHPAWQVSCFTPRLLSVAAKSRKLKSDVAAQVSPLPQLVVEPTSARSNSFVGTHEYLAPEIIKGEGHGSAVDWWTFGIFLFELLYGRTPFKGSGNEETMSNVVSRSLKFPSSPAVSFHARDLIRGLLIKEPENRLGSAKGATEIRQHPFFEGLSWALIRCAAPPELPKVCDAGSFASTASPQDKDSAKSADIKGKEESTEFEMF